jgi:hypothetical protein
MKIIAWNCRGLGNSPAVSGLLKCQKFEEADILFLSKTKLDERRMVTIHVQLGMANMEVVDCEGKGGGLAVLWRRGVDLVCHSKSKYHIDMEVREIGGGWWRFTGIYGEARTNLKHKTWEVMEDLRLQQSLGIPWLCVGDFNEILFHHEKEGGVPRAQACLDRFKLALEKCELHDLGFFGDVFTWRNKQMKGSTHVCERLDRDVANGDWWGKFPLVLVKNGDMFRSDHRPVIILTEKVQRGKPSRGDTGFKFEASWLKEEECRRVVEEAWGQEASGENLSSKIKKVLLAVRRSGVRIVWGI